jgi:hypothetical protein
MLKKFWELKKLDIKTFPLTLNVNQLLDPEKINKENKSQIIQLLKNNIDKLKEAATTIIQQHTSVQQLYPSVKE